MTSPEDRLAELGLSVPVRRAAGRGLRARGAQRLARLHGGPGADARRRAGGRRQGGRRGHGRAGHRVRPAVRAQRASPRSRREVGDLDEGPSGRQGRRVRRVHPRLHRPAGRRERRERAARRGVRRRRASTPAARSAWRPCRSTPRSRSSSWSRSIDALSRIPESLREHVVDAENAQVPVPRDAATIALVRDGDARHRGLPACVGRARMEFAAGMYVFPGGKVHDSDRLVDAWVGPSPEEWAKRFGCDADDRAAGSSSPRCARRSRSRASCSPALTQTTIVADTSAHDMQAARIALESGELRLRRVPGRARPGAAGRPDRRVGALDHAAVRAAALRHEVLRGCAAGGAGGRRAVQARPTAPTGCQWRGCSRPSRPGRRRCCRRRFAPAASSPSSAAADILAAAAEREITPIEPRIVDSRRRAVPRQLPGGMVSTHRAHADSVTDRASTVRADNPGLMTLDGTNTWILREPGATRVGGRRSRAAGRPPTSTAC